MCLYSSGFNFLIITSVQVYCISNSIYGVVPLGVTRHDILLVGANIHHSLRGYGYMYSSILEV